VHKTVSATLLVALICSTGCQEIGQGLDMTAAEGRLVVVLVDKTTPAAEWEVYDTAIEQLVGADEGVGPSDRVVVAPINDETFTAFAPTVDVTFPKSGVALNDEDDAEIARLRLRAAFNEIRAMPRAPWTHIVDGAHVAAQVFRNDTGRTSRHLLLLTDGQEESADANFRERPPSEEETTAIIDRLAAASWIPDLQGVHVYVVGAQAPTPQAMAMVERFWRAFFTAAGAELRPGNYSRAGALLRLVDGGA